MPRLGRRDTALLALLALGMMVIAWYTGGEERVRPIEEDVVVPAGVL